MSNAIAQQLRELGYDLTDPHLAGTPARVARFAAEWHTIGQAPPTVTTFPNGGYDEMVAVGGIAFYSLCAHHGLPFFGTASVGYLPGRAIAGLSKLARVVDHYARRYQTQEALTGQVAAYLVEQLDPVGVGVILRAEHLCMSMRGIQKPGHQTITSVMRGAFRDSHAARAELLALFGAA